MKTIDDKWLERVVVPRPGSHKGENGKLLIVGGSKLFHGASLWALKTATRIVDMVFYASVPANMRLLDRLKAEVFDFIAVPRDKLAEYAAEAEVILIGPGMTRERQCRQVGQVDWEDTYQVMEFLVERFTDKKWVVDAGALQIMEPSWLKRLPRVIITPHLGEFAGLVARSRLDGEMKKLAARAIKERQVKEIARVAGELAREYSCVVVVKGKVDVVCGEEECHLNKNGNEGMAKGGSGDVLAGLIAALACRSELLIAAGAGVYLLGLAGDKLYQKVGPYYNSTDLMNTLPGVMEKRLKQKRRE